MNVHGVPSVEVGKRVVTLLDVDSALSTRYLGYMPRSARKRRLQLVSLTKSEYPNDGLHEIKTIIYIYYAGLRENHRDGT